MTALGWVLVAAISLALGLYAFALVRARKEGFSGKWIAYMVAAIGSLFIVYLAVKSNEIAAADWAQIILTSGLVLVTGVYAVSAAKQADASVKMAKEMREQRYGAVRPIIDIERRETNLERASQVVDAAQLPDKLTCVLRNIGVGPATDVYSYIQAGTQPDEECHRPRAFGALAKGALVKDGEVNEWPLSLKQRDNRKFLVAYYRDVYGCCFESTREISVDKKLKRWEIGPLDVREIAKEEFPK